jgi:hypothetical protein
VPGTEAGGLRYSFIIGTSEIEAMRAAAIAPQGAEFHNFLYAPIYNDREGMTLSVLSAIARQDVDPWTEAARLSQLPRELAVNQIIDMLDALPRRTLGWFDRLEVADRLFALLPRSPSLGLGARLRPPSTEEKNPAKGFTLNWHFLIIYIGAMLLINWAIAQIHARTAAPSESASPSAIVEQAPNAGAISAGRGDAAQNQDH